MEARARSRPCRSGRLVEALSRCSLPSWCGAGSKAARVGTLSARTRVGTADVVFGRVGLVIRLVIVHNGLFRLPVLTHKFALVGGGEVAPPLNPQINGDRR